jgi:hypothetical protein
MRMMADLYASLQVFRCLYILNHKKIIIMRSIKISSILILLFTLSLSGCFKDWFCVEGEGDIETKILVLPAITGISLEEAADVHIMQGEEQIIEVTGHENILDRLQNDVNGGIWEIDLGRECFDHLDLTINITIPVLDEVHLSSSGRITVDDFTGQDKLDVSLTGSGDIIFGSFEGPETLDIKITGSGKVAGYQPFPGLKELNLNLTGSGSFDGFAMVTDSCNARISGSGDLFVHVEEYLKVRITGSGDLHYKGNPIIDATITGSGKIIDRN